MKQQTIVFKVSDNLKDEIIEFYSDRALDKKPPYSVFQVKDYDCVITLYESGKIMFQGIGADIEASYWTEQERIKNKRDVNDELAKDQEKKDKKAEELNDDRFKHISTVGSDEVGTGDFFGPVIVTAAFVDIKKKGMLYELGVRDSKKLTDDKKIKTLQAIQKTMAIPYETRAQILTPLLNKLIDTDVNPEDLVKKHKQEGNDIKFSYEEF